MTRTRASMALACACALAIAGVGGAIVEPGAPDAAQAAPSDQREKHRKRAKLRKLPNVVLVVSDDQTLAQYRPETMPFVSEFLGGGGTTFENAFATSPVCCPSRASMLTGQYPHNHGVLSNVSGYKALRAKRSTLPVWLQKKGYATAHVGKYLNGYAKFIDRKKEKAPGWKEWHTALDNRYYDYDFATNGRVSKRGNAERDYLGRVITQKATKMVNRYAPKRRPLFLQVDYYAPHTQGGGGDEACADAARPDPADKDLFVDDPLPQPPSFDEENVDDKPTFIRRLPQLDEDELENATRRHRCALASLRSVDRGIERIVDALAARGELAKTAIVFTSDNGYFYGEHRLPKEKQQAYEEGIRVPLVARWPDRIGATPATISHPVANIDLAPTILRLAKARPCRPPKGKRSRKRCRTMDGRSLLSLARGELSKFPADRVLAIEYDNTKDFQSRGSTCAFDGVRTPFDMYVEHRRVVADPGAEFCEKTNEEEQYLLADDPSYGSVDDDPFQLRNLTSSEIDDSSDPQVIARRAELRDLLDELRDCAGIPGRDKAPRSGHYCQ